MAYGATAKGLVYGLAAALAAAPAHAAGDGGGGLPQLDFSTWPTQVFWLVVTFALAYLLMWRVVTPAIGSVLEERHTRVSGDMDKARQAAEEAEQMRTAFEARLSEARADAVEKTRETLAESQAKAEKKAEAAAKRLAAKVDEAESAIRKSRDKALKEIDAVATDGAVEAARALAGVKVTKAEAGKAVKAAAKARPAAEGRG